MHAAPASQAHADGRQGNHARWGQAAGSTPWCTGMVLQDNSVGQNITPSAHPATCARAPPWQQACFPSYHQLRHLGHRLQSMQLLCHGATLHQTGRQALRQCTHVAKRHATTGVERGQVERLESLLAMLYATLHTLGFDKQRDILQDCTQQLSRRWGYQRLAADA